jgi:hypothetical protein
MEELATRSVNRALQRDAAERLLEWGFSYEVIGHNLGRSETWVRKVHEARRMDQSNMSNGSEIQARMITPQNEE